MIRLGIDARPLHHLKTGIGQYTLNIIQRIAHQAELEIHLYSRDPITLESYTLAQRHSTTARFIPNFLHAQMFFPIWAAQDQLDLFWSPRHHLPLLMPCACMVTIHDMVWLKHPETMALGGALMERFLMPPSLRKAAAIICVSESTKADLIEFSPRMIEKCTTILEAACQQPGTVDYSPPSRPFFLFVGTQEPRKNFGTCLRAWKESRLADLGYEFLIAGNVGWKVDVAKEINNLGLHQSVKCVTPSSAELEELYSTCFAVVLPSIYEGFGLPLVEGMAFGKPLVTSNVSSMPEVAGDAALLVDPRSTEDLANAFATLAGDPSLYRKLADNSSRRAALFNWDKAANETLDVINSFAGSRVR